MPVVGDNQLNALLAYQLVMHPEPRVRVIVYVRRFPCTPVELLEHFVCDAVRLIDKQVVAFSGLRVLFAVIACKLDNRTVDTGKHPVGLVRLTEPKLQVRRTVIDRLSIAVSTFL